MIILYISYTMSLGYHGQGKLYTYVTTNGIQVDEVKASNGVVVKGARPELDRYTLGKYHTIPSGQSRSGSRTEALLFASYTQATNTVTGFSSAFTTLFGVGSRIMLDVANDITILTVQNVISDTSLIVAPSSHPDVGFAFYAKLGVGDVDTLDYSPVTSGDQLVAVDEGILIRTNVTSTDTVMGPSLDSTWGRTLWRTSDQLRWENRLRITRIGETDSIGFAGLKLTAGSGISDDDDAIFFRVETSIDDLWHVIQSIGGVDTDTTTSVAAVVNTRYVFTIHTDTTRIAKCYINESLVYTSDVLNDVALLPFTGTAIDLGDVIHFVNAYTSISKVL